MFYWFIEMPNDRSKFFPEWPLFNKRDVIFDATAYDIRHYCPVRVTKARLKPSIKLRIVYFLALGILSETAIIPHDGLSVLQAPIAISMISEGNAEAFSGHLE